MQENNNKSLAIASLTLGIIAILGSLIPLLNLISMIIAAIALGLGIAGIVKKQGNMAIAGVILSVLTCIFAFYVNKSAGELSIQLAENLETNLNLEGLEVTGYQLEASSGGSTVTGTVTNHTGNNVKMPIVDFNALDEKGQQIGSCVDAMFGDLPDGSTWDFVATCDASGTPAKIELIGATTPVSVK